MLILSLFNLGLISLNNTFIKYSNGIIYSFNSLCFFILYVYFLSINLPKPKFSSNATTISTVSRLSNPSSSKVA